MSNISIQKKSTRGAALLIFVVLFLTVSLVLVLSIARSAYEDLVAYRLLHEGALSFYGAEAGIEDAIHRHRKGKNYTNSESFDIGDVDVEVARTAVVDTLEIIAEGDAGGAVRTSEIGLALGAGTSFNFGMQSGDGGITLQNSSAVVGNVYSNGSVEGAGNFIYGEVISAGSGGLIDSIHATGSAWAHSIDNSVIDGDAYYYATSTITGTIVGGSSNPNAPDQPLIELPISDEQVEEWKQDIENNGTVIESTSPECSSGTYIISSSTELGNLKIECNVEFKKQGATTNIVITGPLWIEGDLDFTSGPTIIASSSLGSRSVQIIVDKESDRLTSSRVTVNNTTNFSSGNSQSYILIISMNESYENGGTEKAIDLGQTTTGKVLVYAAHGLIEVGQSTALKEITAYRIRLINTAQIVYESGLLNLLFTSGPGGGYSVTSWREVE